MPNNNGDLSIPAKVVYTLMAAAFVASPFYVLCGRPITGIFLLIWSSVLYQVLDRL